MVNTRLSAHIITVLSYELRLGNNLLIFANFKKALVGGLLLICFERLKVFNLRVVVRVIEVSVQVYFSALLGKCVHDRTVLLDEAVR